MFGDLIGCLGAALGFPAMIRGTAGEISQSTEAFRSGGTDILLERFEPRRPGRYPAVILVHGADGLTLAPMYRAIASGLASWEFAVFLPHYFERTGTTFSDDATNRRHFGTWLGTLADTIAHAARQPAVDANRLGLVGVSLGAYLSLAQASMDNRIGAAVDLFGGIPDSHAERLMRMPPTLVLHGADDRVVPVSEAYAVERLLTSKGLSCEIKVYPDQGHILGGQDAIDAMSRMAKFLLTHL